MKKILAIVLSATLFLSISTTAFAESTESTTLSRAQFAKMLLQNEGFADENYKPKTKVRFSDVPLTSKKIHQAPFIYKLIDTGIINFTDFKKSEFEPNKSITKAEALKWTFAAQGILVPKLFDELSFKATDVDLRSPLAPLVNRAIELEVLEPGKVKIYSTVTEADAVQYFKKLRENAGSVTIKLINGNDGDFVGTREYDTFVGTWKLLNSHYLHKDKITREKLMYGAIEGMVKELGDKHTSFERPGDDAIVQSLNGQLEGIGAVLNDKDGDIVVVTPIVGSPADRAGLLPNDIIRQVNDVSVQGLALNAVVAKIKGPKGTVVKITVQRGKVFKTFSITREVITVKSIEYSRTEDNIFVIRISSFGQSTATEFDEALAELSKQEARGIIIDLRYNPGGYLNIVDDMAGHFIPMGQLITTVRYPDHSEPETSKGRGELNGKKIMVLVNSGSASASEILAGALKDYGIATIIGEVTYGKGTVQELDDFSDGSTLKLTIAEWLTPKGNTIDGKGITPDIVVTNPKPKAGQKAVDAQMNRAKAEILK